MPENATEEGRWPADAVQRMQVEDLVPYARNARVHSDEQVEQLVASIREWGWTVPVLVDDEGGIIAGHGRVLAARNLGLATSPVMVASGWTEAQKRAYVLADNQLALNASWDEKLVAVEIEELRGLDFDVELVGFTNAELDKFMGIGGPAASGALKARYICPPFSVLNAREGEWQERKREWIALGIKSEEGRGKDLAYNIPDSVREWAGASGPEHGGTSIFDPVLCEIMYAWFCPPGGQVVDPFAGGSVRGVVASVGGFRYWGNDLSNAQVEANRTQASDICANADHMPVWSQGDSRVMLAGAPDADYILSCPPYGDLEVYSDDPDDLSNMPYADFLDGYREVIRQAVAKLKPDSFATFVVGDFRDKSGALRGFIGDTVDAFEAAGCTYYNHAILITPVGTLPVRAGKPFEATRKLGKTHQDVLVFVKGDARAATQKLNA